MLRVRLQKGDGIAGDQAWRGPLVKKCQLALNEAGFACDADGRFGSGTERVLKEFQVASGLAETGIVDRSTWDGLGPHIEAVLGERSATIAEQLPGFRGDLEVVHREEGHNGHPYWPGGASGVTLDPGIDLGHADPELLRSLYQDHIPADLFELLESVLGLRGESAKAALASEPRLREISVSREQAEESLPFAASSYWKSIADRFTTLRDDDIPGAVQTALLSLAYNRGARNSRLEPLRGPMDARDWAAAADVIGGMQQDHPLAGIQARRRREASFIRAELELA